MESRLLMTVRLTSAPIQAIGALAQGKRAIFPITGGEFSGPRLHGRVLPGGGDWALERADGVLELDLRVTLESDDGALIHMTFEGMRHGPEDVIAALGRGEAVDRSRYYFRTLPRFETAAPQYAFLNRLLAVSISENTPQGPLHTIDEIL